MRSSASRRRGRSNHFNFFIEGHSARTVLASACFRVTDSALLARALAEFKERSAKEGGAGNSSNGLWAADDRIACTGPFRMFENKNKDVVKELDYTVLLFFAESVGGDATPQTPVSSRLQVRHKLPMCR